MPRFSIIVPVYNVQNYLAACVKSVAEQAGERDWECILVDDGSTDMSGTMCDAFAAEIPGMQVVHRKNGGLAAARNTGLKHAQGEWVLFLDSDDAMASGLLAALRTELAAHPEYDWFIGKHLEWQPDGSLTEHAGLHLVPGMFDSSDYAARLKALYGAGHWSVWKYCIRRSFLAESGVRFLPDCVWAEDWPFDLELLIKCERLYFLDVVFTHYRVGRQGSLLTDAKNLPKRFKGLAAAQRRLAKLSASGAVDAETTTRWILATALPSCPGGRITRPTASRSSWTRAWPSAPARTRRLRSAWKRWTAWSRAVSECWISVPAPAFWPLPH